MTQRETAKQIDMVAADWVARLDRGDLSLAEDAELDAWLKGDPRRVGAFAKAKAVALYTQRAQALGPDFDADRFTANPHSPAPLAANQGGMSRRKLLWGGGAVAAGLGAAITTGIAVSSYGVEYSTARGQMKVIPLADGSIVSLNTQSRIRVAYTDERRTIHLEDGEALFDVAKDALRPFLVLAGEAQIVATGTSFVVRRLASAPVEVLVREGTVEFNRRSQGAPVLRLAANMRAVETPEAAPKAAIAVSTDEVKRAMAWREGRIAFEGQSLREAAEEFHRYSDTRIIIDDPVVARQAVTGLFQVNDPIGFAQAVATSFDLHAEVGDKQVRLYR